MLLGGWCAEACRGQDPEIGVKLEPWLMRYSEKKVYHGVSVRAQISCVSRCRTLDVTHRARARSRKMDACFLRQSVHRSDPNVTWMRMCYLLKISFCCFPVEWEMPIFRTQDGSDASRAHTRRTEHARCRVHGGSHLAPRHHFSAAH